MVMLSIQLMFNLLIRLFLGDHFQRMSTRIPPGSGVENAAINIHPW